MKTLVFIGMIGFILLFMGCGEGQKIITDPNTVKIIEDTAGAAVTITQGLGALWPALIPIGTAGAGILAAYKRLKPKIEAANKTTDKCLAAGSTLTTILEDIKVNEPDLWKKIGPKIAAASESAKDIETTIADFRRVGA